MGDIFRLGTLTYFFVFVPLAYHDQSETPGVRKESKELKARDEELFLAPLCFLHTHTHTLTLLRLVVVQTGGCFIRVSSDVI